MRVRQHQQQVPQLFVEMRTFGLRQAKEVAPLTDEDDHAYTGREAHDHRRRYELNHAAHARDTHQQQHRAGHQRRDLQAGDAVLRRDAGEDGNERAGRAGDLQACSAQQRDQAAADNRSVDTLLRARAGRYREGHRQRKRDHADDDAGNDVRQPVGSGEQPGAAGFDQRDHVLFGEKAEAMVPPS